MKKSALVLMFLFISVCSYAQTVTIVDKSSLHPVNGAVIKSDNKTVTTNAQGQADISDFKGSDKIEIITSDYNKEILSYSTIEALNFTIQLTDKSYHTDEIVISANKFDINSKYLPRQVEVINSEDIKFGNSQTTADLLSNTGNILVQKSQQGGGSPIIRGFEANKVLIMIDGVRINNAIFRGGHLQNVLRIDENVLSRTEILYGSGSTIYGSDALGGVMSFFSKDPVLSLKNKMFSSGNAFFRYSSSDMEKTGHFDLNLASKKVGFLGSFTYSDFGDLRMGTQDIKNDKWLRNFTIQRINGRDTAIATNDKFLQTPSGYHQYDILGKFLIRQSQNVTHTFNFQFSNTNDIPRYDRLNEVGTSAEWYYGPEKRLLGSYKFDLKSGTGFFNESKILLAYQDIQESRNNRNLNSSNLTSRNEEVKVYSLNADFNKMIKKHNISYGLEGIYNDVTSTAFRKNINTGVESPQSTRYPDGGSNMKSFAVYLQDMYRFNDMVSVNAGARFNYVSLHSEFKDSAFFPFLANVVKEIDQTNSAVSGNLGITFLPKDDWRIYLNGSSGFRAPNVDDLAKVFDPAPGEVVVPNKDLGPEYTLGGEFGISKIIADRVKAEAIGYYTHISDIIVTAPFKFNGQDSITYDGVRSRVMANQNLNSGYIYGIGVNLNVNITENISLINTVNYTYGRLKTDSTDYPLDHIAPLFGKSGITGNFNRFRTEFNIMYNAWKLKKDFNLNGEDNFAYATPEGSPNWFTLNLKTAYQFNKNLQLQLDVNNLLDKNYRVFASGINASGISSVLTLRGNF
ncbi:MAG: TonB-dependent receptor [Bacteroidetes bacterium]|nr:TonB-dependent receptor [Bacteroidota bacterium]